MQDESAKNMTPNIQHTGPLCLTLVVFTDSLLVNYSVPGQY